MTVLVVEEQRVRIQIHDPVGNQRDLEVCENWKVIRLVQEVERLFPGCQRDVSIHVGKKCQGAAIDMVKSSRVPIKRLGIRKGGHISVSVAFQEDGESAMLRAIGKVRVEIVANGCISTHYHPKMKMNRVGKRREYMKGITH